ncbi:MAG: Cof-type HAD-IIB family hydrolase [Lachnospiraceae bacterium]
MNIQLVALDLDGTLYNSNKEITPNTKAAIERIILEGKKAVIATGRPFSGITDNVLAIKGLQYAICSNGSSIYEIKTGKCLYEDSMPTTRVKELVIEAMSHPVMVEVFLAGHSYIDSKYSHIIESMDMPESAKEYFKKVRVTVDHVEEYLLSSKDKPQKVSVNFTKEEDGTYLHRNELLEIATKYPEFIGVSGGLGNLEFTNTTATKGNALIKLAQLLNLSIDQTMGIGDSENDKDMILKAGIGVAMANAEPEILQIADFVTKSNNEDGIAYAIEQFIK